MTMILIKIIWRVLILVLTIDFKVTSRTFWIPATVRSTADILTFHGGENTRGSALLGQIPFVVKGFSVIWTSLQDLLWMKYSCHWDTWDFPQCQNVCNATGPFFCNGNLGDPTQMMKRAQLTLCCRPYESSGMVAHSSFQLQGHRGLFHFPHYAHSRACLFSATLTLSAEVKHHRPTCSQLLNTQVLLSEDGGQRRAGFLLQYRAASVLWVCYVAAVRLCDL